MNRRHFIKSAAVLALAGPMLPKAVAAVEPVKTLYPAGAAIYRVNWNFISSQGQLTTPDFNQALNFARGLLCEWIETGRPLHNKNDIPSIVMTKNGEPVKWMWDYWTKF